MEHHLHSLDLSEVLLELEAEKVGIYHLLYSHLFSFCELFVEISGDSVVDPVDLRLVGFVEIVLVQIGHYGEGPIEELDHILKILILLGADCEDIGSLVDVDVLVLEDVVVKENLYVALLHFGPQNRRLYSERGNED